MDYLLDIGIYETLPTCTVVDESSGDSGRTTSTLVSSSSALQHVESSDDDFDKITHEDVAEVAEHFDIPSINTQYKGLHL